MTSSVLLRFSLLATAALVFLIGCSGPNSFRSPPPENPAENIHTWVRHIKGSQEKYKAWGAWEPIYSTAAGTYLREYIKLGLLGDALDWRSKGILNSVHRRTDYSVLLTSDEFKESGVTYNQWIRESVDSYLMESEIDGGLANARLRHRRVDARYAKVIEEISRYCVKHKGAELYHLEISNEESSAVHLRPVIITGATRRLICVSKAGSQKQLMFLVDIHYVVGFPVYGAELGIELISIEPSPELAQAYLQDWSPGKRVEGPNYFFGVFDPKSTE